MTSPLHGYRTAGDSAIDAAGGSYHVHHMNVNKSGGLCEPDLPCPNAVFLNSRL